MRSVNYCRKVGCGRERRCGPEKTLPLREDVAGAETAIYLLPIGVRPGLKIGRSVAADIDVPDEV